jgi:predicted nucleotidyltransferase
MKTRIKEKLAEIEAEYNIKILHASETGSRGWGFPSPDSDYDVRLIYVHPEDWYVSLSEPKDSLELMLDDRNLDIAGWDLRKALRLLTKSNASLFERMQSPIVYQTETDFMTELNTVAQAFFSPKATLHHYLSMAKKSIEGFTEQEPVKFKKLFYALRAATACQWIFDKGTIPPIVFMEMVDRLELAAELLTEIKEMMQVKERESEAYVHQPSPIVLAYINEQILKADKEAKGLAVGKGDVNELNKLLRKTIKSF